MSKFENAEQCLNEFIDALSCLDSPRLADCFDDEISVFFPFNELRVSGKEHVIECFSNYFEDVEKANSTSPSISIHPEDIEQSCSNDISLTTFHIIREEEVCRRTLVLRRHEDGWKVLHLHASNQSK